MLSVVDERNASLTANAPRPVRVARPESTYLVVNMMRGVLNNATAAAARSMGFTADAAGKTGTTNDLRDAWFATGKPVYRFVTRRLLHWEDNEGQGPKP